MSAWYEPVPTAVPDGRPSGRRRALRLGIEIVETVVLTAVLFLGIHTFVAQPYQIQMSSMESTLLAGQYVLVDKLTPRWAPYQRGDIVVFDAPDAWNARVDGVPYIKRVVGIEGDRVELREGRVYVNGAEIREPYLYRRDGAAEPTNPGFTDETSWTVPADSLFLMGDHRQASADSRSFGPIETSRVVGRAWVRYWPLDTISVLARPVEAASQ
jgi:signal peptidase I